jgi:hypothetical protein
MEKGYGDDQRRVGNEGKGSAGRGGKGRGKGGERNGDGHGKGRNGVNGDDIDTTGGRNGAHGPDPRPATRPDEGGKKENRNTAGAQTPDQVG